MAYEFGASAGAAPASPDETDYHFGLTLEEWARDKPLSILQLDPADRAVLRIAGTTLPPRSSPPASLSNHSAVSAAELAAQLANSFPVLFFSLHSPRQVASRVQFRDHFSIVGRTVEWTWPLKITSLHIDIHSQQLFLLRCGH